MGFELYFQRFFVCLVEDEDLKGILCSLGLIVWECACRGSEEWLNGRKGKKFSCSASVIFFFYFKQCFYRWGISDIWMICGSNLQW